MTQQPSRLAFFLLVLLANPLAFAAGSPDKHPAPVETAAGFEFRVADVFKIAGTGTVVVGQVQSGRVTTGSPACIDGIDGPRVIAGIEQFNRILTSVAAGANAGLLFQDVDADAVSIGASVRSCE